MVGENDGQGRAGRPACPRGPRVASPKPRRRTRQKPRRQLRNREAVPAASGPVVPVVLPKVQKVTEYIELTGNAASVNTVKLIARVDGYLEKIHFQDGQLVKKGDLLFTIQQEQYKAQLVQAEAQVKATQAALFLRKYGS